MDDPTPQAADGKVLWHFLMSLDGFVAGSAIDDGIRLFDHPGGAPVRLGLINADDPTRVVNLRYRPVR